MTVPRLARRLRLGDAVVIGVGSMVGAGVFSAFAPAAAVAGTGLLAGLVLAGLVAAANAGSTAQLAAQYPHAGGSYLYGRERLGAWPGFLAGWSFVIGKTASCAAMALTVAAYLVPADWQRPAAAAIVAALTVVNLLGITRTALLTRILVAVALLALAAAVGAGASYADPSMLVVEPPPAGAYGVLQSAGLLFFAFAGYARIATLGEEVIEPERTIPRAIVIALGIALLVYLAVGLALLGGLGAERLGRSAAPLADLVEPVAPWLLPMVTVGAAAAGLGALLALIAGVGRTSLAMARHGDLPRPLAAVHPRRSVPYRAEAVVGIAVIAIVLLADVRGAIGFSSFGVLLYYLVANLSALTQDRAHRRMPRALSALGAVGCVALAVTLPPVSALTGIGVLAVGVLIRFAALRVRQRAG